MSFYFFIDFEYFKCSTVLLYYNSNNSNSNNSNLNYSNTTQFFIIFKCHFVQIQIIQI